MNYELEEQLIKSWFNGLREGLIRYAHWKDGVQYVGTCGRTLKEAIADAYVEETQRIASLVAREAKENSKATR